MVSSQENLKTPIVIYKFYHPDIQLPEFNARGKPTFKDLRKFANTIDYNGAKYGITKLEFYKSLKLFIDKKNNPKIIPEITLHTIYKDTQIYLNNIDKEREITHQKLMNRLKKKYSSI